MPRSVNFAFLAGRHDRIESIAANAEQDWGRNPVGSLIQVRLFSELLASQVAVNLRTLNGSANNFADVIDAIARAGIPAEVITLFHELRRKGNEATHRAVGDVDTSLAHRRLAQQLAVWYWRTFHDSSFKAPAFAKPEDPSVTTAQLAGRVSQDPADELASALVNRVFVGRDVAVVVHSRQARTWQAKQSSTPIRRSRARVLIGRAR